MAPQHDIHSWRAWYADGTAYNSRDHVWTELPQFGCIVLLVYKNATWGEGKRYRTVYGGTDIIGLGDGWVHQIQLGDWTGKPEPGLISQAMEEYPESATNEWKFGQAVPDEQYLETYAAAHAAQDPP